MNHEAHEEHEEAKNIATDEEDGHGCEEKRLDFSLLHLCESVFICG
jgi:hypothetical protein